MATGIRADMVPHPGAKGVFIVGQGNPRQARLNNKHPVAVANTFVLLYPYFKEQP
jgi:hypothetical protein